MAETTHSASPATAEAAPVMPVLFKARGRGKAKANMRKRSPTPPPRAAASDSDSDSDDSASGDGRDVLRDAKRRRKNKAGAGLVTASSEGAASGPSTGRDLPQHVVDRKALLAESDVATKRSHMFDGEEGNPRDKTKTQSKGPTGPAAGPPPRAVGPIKAPANIRTITVTDFAPDVCKDYKLTGFCGFGDNCKFLHAREDYKQGWQLDNEWEAVTKGKTVGGTIVASADRTKKPAADADADDDDDEIRDIPFACIICQAAYRQPVVTRCGHYFCEPCALTRYRRDPSCAACGAATTGVFNTAKRLTKLLERKRARAAQRRQAAIDAGEEVSSEDEEGATSD